MTNDIEIKETVHVEPTKDDELVSKSPQPEQKEEKVASEEVTSKKKEEIEGPKKEIVEKKEELVHKKPDDKPILADGTPETPKERAFRLEADRLRGLLNKEKTKEMFQDEPISPKTKGLSPEKEAILSQYDQTEVKNLEQVFDLLAEKQGYVKKDELQAQEYIRIRDDITEKFLEDHPEYQDITLWNELKNLVYQYRVPENPRDVSKLLNSAHRQLFNIQSSENLSKIQAQKEKLETASHAGQSAKTAQPRAREKIDRNMFKGFSDEELDNLVG